jgi:endonuclease G
VPEAAQAELDTFHFTNCSAHHAAFKQHWWLSLEDYLRGYADTLDVRACVFTGPVLSDDDPAYRDVQLPRAFWKVAVMRLADGGQLSATAYLVSQADLISNIEFVYGQFKTYQLPITQVQKLTGLQFRPLIKHDPLNTAKTEAFEVTSGDDVKL